ncbi:hypothetical protein SLEP1_g37317 [Rubroshorea leprosula]|uniref:Cation/H+ exchanger domain-containing protein n=1 Tax=Rubroshorea leprosula TaxID=152421 RepID=A0AAV5KUW4_9ROSI|nr:hypothetical protein SLEP1_g37317 [Rubroshorea leprosula]
MVELHNGTASLQWQNRTEHLPTLCLPGPLNLFSRGIWYGENPLDFVGPLFMFQVIASFVFSRTFYFLLRPFGTPKWVCSVLGGIVLGPSVLGRFPRFMETFYPNKVILLLNTVSTFSILYYVFFLAVKMDLAKILRTAKDAWSIGPCSFFFSFFFILCVYFLLQDFLPVLGDRAAPIITFAIMSANSLSDMINAMNELKFLNSELGELAMSSAAFNEMIMWIILVVTSDGKQEGSFHSFHSLVFFGAFGLIVFCLVRPALLWVIKKTPEGKPVDEGVIVALLLGSAVVGLITDSQGMGFLPGILLMGLIIPSGPPLGATLIGKSELLVQEIFLHFVFLSVGRVTDVSQIHNWKEFAAMLLIILATSFGKFLAVFMGLFHFKMRSRNILLLGLMLNMKGPIELIFLTKQMGTKYIDPQFYVMLVFSSLVMTGIGAHLLLSLYKPHVRLEVYHSLKLSMRLLLVTPNGGEFRILSCIHNEDDVHGIISLLEAVNPTEGSPLCAYVIHIVELVGRVAPPLAPYKYQRKFKHNSTDRIMRAFTNYSNDSPKSITVLPFSLAAPYSSMHESICRLAHSEFIPLILVPYYKSQVLGTTGSIHSFNNNLLACAPCTVGILVQRKNFSHRLGCSVSFSHFSYDIAVIFLGGDDDREALTLADRMSGHPCVSITVLRIIYAENGEKNEPKLQQDDKFFKEFKEKHAGNACVVTNEIVAENSVEVINAFNSLDGCYDLLLVGRKPEVSEKLEEELGNWTECPELGVIGDVVASPDFRGDVVSVLVLHHAAPGGGGNVSVYNGSMSAVTLGAQGSYSFQNTTSTA